MNVSNVHYQPALCPNRGALSLEPCTLEALCQSTATSIQFTPALCKAGFNYVNELNIRTLSFGD